MYNKIALMLDEIADSLEAKGLLKEALEVDKIADMIEAAVPYGMTTPLGEEFSKALRDFRMMGSRPTLQQVRERTIAALDAAVGKGLSKDRRDKYVDYIMNNPRLQDSAELMTFVSNVALKPGFGKQFEKQMFREPA